MEHLNLGTTGAKVATWHKPNARELLVKIVKENPGADEEAIYHAFATECGAYFPEIVRYWVRNNLRSLQTKPAGQGFAIVVEAPQPKQSLAEPVTVDAIAKSKAKVKDRARDLVLLDLVMANGKPLRDCTGAECKALGPKMGAWLTRIGEAIKPNQKAGDALSEEQVRSLYGSH
jgi:hypothetical protein